MANQFPTALNSYTGNETLFNAGHAQAHNSYESKIGITASTPVANTVLRGTGTGTSAWAQVNLSTDTTGTLDVSQGGTGHSTLTSGTILAGNGTSAVSLFTTTGSGTVVALATSPTLVTPALGVATATSINKVTITAPATSATLTLDNSVTFRVTSGGNLALGGKTLTLNNSLTLAGTDSTAMTFPATSGTVDTLNSVQTFTAKKTFAGTVQTITSYSPSGGATATLDLSLGNVFTVNIPAGNITLALSNASTGQPFIVNFVNNASVRVVTYFTTIKWPGGAAPTLSGGTGVVDTFGFLVTGSGTYNGYIVGQALA